MPEAERAVCRRLRKVREELSLSRRKFGRKINLDSSEVSNLENARVLLRFHLAKRIGEEFGVSLAWLAEGKGLMWGYKPVHDFLNDSRTFTTVFALIKPELESRAAEKDEWESLGIDLRHQLPVGAPPEERTLEFLKLQLRPHLRSLPPGLRNAFRAATVRAAEEFVTAVAKTTSKGRSLLTNVSESVKHRSVKTQMPGLLDRLRVATSYRGGRTDLAVAMGVPLASISQWLSGEREPGGETTLRLLQWVQSAEANQQKRPGAVITSTEPETRKRPHEKHKPKSSQP